MNDAMSIYFRSDKILLINSYLKIDIHNMSQVGKGGF